MAVFTNASRRRVDRISAAVGATAFVLGLTAVLWGAASSSAAPATVTTTVVSSPIPGAASTQTVLKTSPPTRPTLEPRVTQEVTTTESTTPGSVVISTAPAPVEPIFLGSAAAGVVFQVILVTLLALFLAFATQRMLLGEYGIRRPALAAGDESGDLIGTEEAEDSKREVVAAGEQRDATRAFFDSATVPDPRLRLLQYRIDLELEVRMLAQQSDVASNLSIEAVVKGLVQKKRMTPKLASAVVALGAFGDRLSRGADLSLDAMTTLGEAYEQALGKVGGKIRSR